MTLFGFIAKARYLAFATAFVATSFSFAGPVPTTVSSWQTDKYPAGVFELLPSYQGNSNVLHLGLDTLGPITGPTRWQGRSVSTPAVSGFSVTSGRVHLPATWASAAAAADQRETALWSLLTNATSTYRAGVVFSNAGGSGQFASQYEHRLETNAVYAAGTNTSPTLLAGYVTNANNAADVDISTYATLVVPLNLLGILPPSYLDLSFPADVAPGSVVGFTVSQSSTLLSLSLLSNLSVTAYDASNNAVATHIGFGLSDLVPVPNHPDKYTLSFVTPPGPYTIRRIKLNMTGVLGVLESINVHDGFARENGSVTANAVTAVYGGWNNVCHTLDGANGVLRTYVNGQLLSTDAAPADRALSQMSGVALGVANAAGVAAYDAYWSDLAQGQLTSVVAVNGSAYRAEPGAAFAPLVVEARDASGSPLPCVPITVTAPGSGSTAALSTTSVLTDASGRATVNATANTITGAYSVTFDTAVAGVAPLALQLTNAFNVVLEPAKPVPLDALWIALTALLVMASAVAVSARRRRRA